MNKKNINKTKYRKFLKGETEILMFWFFIFIRFPKIWQQWVLKKVSFNLAREVGGQLVPAVWKESKKWNFWSVKKTKMFCLPRKIFTSRFSANGQRTITNWKRPTLAMGRQWWTSLKCLTNSWPQKWGKLTFHLSNQIKNLVALEGSFESAWAVVSYLFWVGEHFFITKNSWEHQDHQKAILWRECQFFKYLGALGECFGFTFDQGEHWLGNT